MAKNVLYFPFYSPPVTGGDFIALDHVAELNRVGFDARVLYLGPDDGLARFPVPAMGHGNLALRDGDIFVIGEIHRMLFDQLRNLRCIKVMHNQNPFYTFVGFDSAQKLNDYPLTHIITLSRYSLNKLRELGVSGPISYIHPFVPEYFAPRPKRLQIAFSPVKRPAEASYVIGRFKSAYPELADVPCIPLFKMTRPECARIMAESAVYASFPQLESLGLMALEAFACGCHVVGYDGMGGKEYADDSNGFWVDDGDHDGFVRRIKEACDLFLSSRPNPFVANGLMTAGRFSFANFAEGVRQTYTEIMAQNAEHFRK